MSYEAKDFCWSFILLYGKFSNLLQCIGSGELRGSEGADGQKEEKALVFILPKSCGIIVSYGLGFYHCFHWDLSIPRIWVWKNLEMALCILCFLLNIAFIIISLYSFSFSFFNWIFYCSPPSCLQPTPIE